jgi:hypothetical protein
MFAEDFWPTPRPVARGMVNAISKDAQYFLEPSAGMGHLADVIKKPYTWEEARDEIKREREEDGETFDPADKDCRSIRRRAGDDDNYERKVEIDVIEPQPEFCHVLYGKEYTLVGHDFLNYEGVSYYDAIVMNPPFSEGDKHLLKAWDFLYKGEIVCLLNKETINNPYTETRQRLVKLVMEHGNVKQLGYCFAQAERASNVEVVQVYLKKEAPDDTFDLWATESGTQEDNPEVESSPDNNFVALRDNLANMVRWYELANRHFIKGFEELRRGMLYVRQNKIDGSYYEDRKDYGSIAAQALSSSHAARTDFLRKHRKDAWKSVFRQMQFQKWLDSKQQDKMMAQVSRDANYPFTVENIKGTLENVFLSRKKLFEQSVANVFDELCSHAIENGCGPEVPAGTRDWNRAGWKTNDTYKVNERLVFPHGVRFDGYFSTGWGDSDRIYTDLDRILCVLDAERFEECYTVGGALQRAFGLNRSQPGTCESQYFEIRYFKKGTVHLKWKRRDLLESFNKTAAAGKKWLGADTSFKKAAWRERPDYYCEHHGHEFEDGVCKCCERPEVDPLDVVQCEYCRVIAEYTGREHCPIHREVEIAPPDETPLQIEAPEEEWDYEQVS